MNDNAPIILSRLSIIPTKNVAYLLPREDPEIFDLFVVGISDIYGNIYVDDIGAMTQKPGIDISKVTHIRTIFLAYPRLKDIELDCLYIDYNGDLPDPKAGYKVIMYSLELGRWVTIGNCTKRSIPEIEVIQTSTKDFPDRVIPDSIHTYFVPNSNPSEDNKYKEYKIVSTKVNEEWVPHWEEIAGDSGGGSSDPDQLTSEQVNALVALLG